METALSITMFLTVSAFARCGNALESHADAMPEKNRLGDILLKWHEAMAKPQTLSCHFERIDMDRLYQTTETTEGTFKYLKPDCAFIETRKKGANSLDSKIVYHGKRVWTYFPSRREIIAFRQDRDFALLTLGPDPLAGVSFNTDNQSLSIANTWIYRWFYKPFEDEYRILFHAEPSYLKDRYDLKLLGENQWYFFILITPRDRVSAAAFTRARLTLRKDNHLPRQLWFEEANGNETTWDFLQLDTAARLSRKDFTPIPPPGWHISDPSSAK